MEGKLTDTINNVCTILGGALLLYPLIDEATKTLIPEMQKLTSGETLEELKLSPPDQEKKSHDEKQQQEKHKNDNEISELKRKLAEYEGKQDEHKIHTEHKQHNYQQ